MNTASVSSGTSDPASANNSATASTSVSGNCDPSYPTICIPPPPPDLDCGNVPYRNFAVSQPDPHGFDGDNDGVGCESSRRGLLASAARPQRATGRFTFRGRVTYVVDGDTLDVRLDNGSAMSVRLIGIDTPERGECFSRQATAAARRLASGRRVVLRGDPTQATRDRYGRLLAYAWIRGSDLGYRLIAGGYGRVYIYDHPFQRLSAYRHAEKTGKSRTRSIWTCGQNPEPLPPGRCDPSYPDVCIPPPPPDLDCADVPYTNFRVVGRDPHRFDGEADGIGCET